MFFGNLPPHLQKAVKALTVDEEFNRQLTDDKVLDRLDDLEINRKFERQCLDILLSKDIIMFGHTFKPLTAIAVMKLWTNFNPIITGEGNVELKHIDEFFQLLEYPETDEPCEGFAEANYFDIADKLDEVVKFELKTAFQPLSMFPVSIVKGGEQIIFDADWIVRLASVACNVGGMKFDEALRLPMFTLTSMFVQYARMQGTKNIERQAPEEILKQQGHRVCELVIDRLIQLGKIDSSDRDKYIEMVANKD